MSAKIAINGIGRIGRLALRAMIERHRNDLNVVAINNVADLPTNAHLFRYHSTHGIIPGKIETGEGELKIDDWEIVVLNQKDPARLPWRTLGVDIVIESTGVFTHAAQVQGHLEAGAKKVIVTAPATVVMEGKMAKILSWYDNESGYSCRVGDLATFMAEREL